MAIVQDIQSLSLDRLITLFKLDLTSVGQGVMYLAPATNGFNGSIVWQGNTYAPLPIEAEGFELTVKGALPRPRVRVANVMGLFSAEVRQLNDLVGCKITRQRTFLKYLDAVNFPGNVNPTADPNQHFIDDVWYIEKKTSENKYLVEWELSSAFDLMGVQLPFRQVIQNTCPWQYKGAECNYTGTNYFDIADNPTNAAGDICGKTLNSCKIRFGATSNLNFGGFPGVVRY